MIEYEAVIKRHKGSSKPDIYLIRDENKETVLKAMKDYCKQNGFTVVENGGRFTIANIVLIEREPIFGAPILSETPYIEIFGS
jgi:hypothetical protein